LSTQAHHTPFASRIPNATLNIRNGGHFMAHRHYQETFVALMR
jgi:hypothetical protein